jgi:hypothetical protein
MNLLLSYLSVYWCVLTLSSALYLLPDRGSWKVVLGSTTLEVGSTIGSQDAYAAEVSDNVGGLRGRVIEVYSALVY